MELNLPAHRLFEDFKHFNLEVDLTLCWIPAAGGHFICNAISDIKHQPSSVNEYGHGESLWNYIDSENLYDIEPENTIEYFDKVYKTAHNLDFSKKNMILRSHMYPLLLPKVVNYRSKEIVIIYPDEEGRYLLSILSSIKHRLNPVLDTSAVTDILGKLFESNIKVHEEDITSLTDQIIIYSDYNADVRNTAIVWDYFLHCKTHNLISTKSIFNEFMKDLFNNCIVFDNITPEFGLPDIVEYLSQFGNCKIINYTDLFFKLKIPSDSLLSRINKTELYNYSKTNLKLVIEFLSLVDDAEATKIKTYIALLKHQLEESIRKYNSGEIA